MKLLTKLEQANHLIIDTMNMLYNANNHASSCELFYSGTCDCSLWTKYIQDGGLLRDFNKINKLLKKSEAHSDMLANERELLKEVFHLADKNLHYPHTNEEWALDERIKHYKKYVADQEYLPENLT